MDENMIITPDPADRNFKSQDQMELEADQIVVPSKHPRLMYKLQNQSIKGNVVMLSKFEEDKENIPPMFYNQRKEDFVKPTANQCLVLHKMRLANPTNGGIQLINQTNYLQPIGSIGRRKCIMPSQIEKCLKKQTVFNGKIVKAENVASLKSFRKSNDKLILATQQENLIKSTKQLTHPTPNPKPTLKKVKPIQNIFSTLHRKANSINKSNQQPITELPIPKGATIICGKKTIFLRDVTLSQKASNGQVLQINLISIKDEVSQNFSQNLSLDAIERIQRNRNLSVITRNTGRKMKSLCKET